MSDAVCPPGTRFAAAVEAVREGTEELGDAVTGLLDLLTDEELLGTLDGDPGMMRAFADMVKGYNSVPFVAGRVDRLGIPGIRFTDGPRGVVMGSSTSFPVAISRAAAFDVDLERRLGDAIGAESRAQGANLFAGVCVNVAPSPGWGRAQESYGEDSVLIGAMGAALVEGVKPWALTCVKHYALNSMEEARFQVDVQVDEDVLREAYLPHFKAAVDAGADSMMSAYNSVNGAWAGENHHLLTEVLRDDWGFTGFVMTDFVWGLRDPVGSVLAGQDLEMPMQQQRAEALPKALADGRLTRDDLRRNAGRILAAQINLALRARPTPPLEVVAMPKHRDLAREAARLGTVLLRNEASLLPLSAEALTSVAVVGPLADQANLGDVGSSRVRPPSTSSVLAALREELGSRVQHASDRTAAVEIARHADVAVVVVGLSSKDEGEAMVGVDPAAVALLGGAFRRPLIGKAFVKLLDRIARSMGMGGDRRDLRLHAEDVELIRAVAAVNERTVVVLIGGSTLVVDPWDQDVPAVLHAWYPGMEGGRALADILLGAAEPGGRLPVAVPHGQSDLPVIDWKARMVRYERWWGQHKLDIDGVPAAYPFGFGLGYTTFSLQGMTVGPVEEGHVDVEVTVTNTGQRHGRHVVQVYAVRPHESGRAVRLLVGFQPVWVESGSSVTVTVSCTLDPLRRWTADGFVLDETEIVWEAASFSGDSAALSQSIPIAAEAARRGV